MHSSRMRTARALTVSGGGGASQKKFWGKRNWKKKEKKIEKKNLETPRKIGDTPPKNERHPLPKKLETPP